MTPRRSIASTKAVNHSQARCDQSGSTSNFHRCEALSLGAWSVQTRSMAFGCRTARTIRFCWTEANRRSPPRPAHSRANALRSFGRMLGRQRFWRQTASSCERYAIPTSMLSSTICFERLIGVTIRGSLRRLSLSRRWSAGSRGANRRDRGPIISWPPWTSVQTSLWARRVYVFAAFLRGRARSDMALPQVVSDRALQRKSDAG